MTTVLSYGRFYSCAVVFKRLLYHYENDTFTFLLLYKQKRAYEVFIDTNNNSYTVTCVWGHVGISREFYDAMISTYVKEFMFDCCFVFVNFWATFCPSDEIHHYLISYHGICIEDWSIWDAFLPNPIGGGQKHRTGKIWHS